MTPHEKMTFDYLNNPDPLTPQDVKRSQSQEGIASKLMYKLFELLDDGS